ncbi:hypothetical protein [Paenibacillus xanthanilyticus]|uniref:SMI1/KNR4 family protein n=1 Tax=Paenibacillus xanthanilyticus TaxID=1783531 RepID=A0ABV8K194_9BACL
MNNHYRTPVLLEQIITWEREYSHEVGYLENPTGLYLGIDFNTTDGYFCTPVDCFPFADTGADGEHFGLLTDFGFVKDLNEAPVIRISPMHSDHVQLVARNLNDFFSLHFYDELLLMNDYSSEDEYLERVRQEESKDLNSEWFDHDRWKKERAKVLNEVQEKFNLYPIADPVHYLQDIRLERQLQIAIKTEDSLGIVRLPTAIPPEKELLLASVRNLQFTACSDRNIVERHAKELVGLGMTKEAESLLVRLLR